ncbi:MAG: UbiD family decarboxylase, partial [Deltaproteobacteria bacterium]|nr:UbiD family decarboxylase [Deltaproteobacteria bacterium]
TDYNDLRDFIRLMEEKGQLKRIKKEVNWDQEISAVFIKSCKQKNRALLFEKVRDSSMPLLIGSLASAERIRMCVGKTEAEMDDFIKNVLNTKREEYPPVKVEKGVSQEVVQKGDDIDLFALPIPKFAEKEGGRYITAGVSISKDPERGSGNAGVYRMMVRSKNEINVNFGFPNRHLLIHAKKAKQAGKPLPVAIAIGCDPALWLCGSFPFPAKIDEIVQAGAVMEKGVEMVKAKTIDLDVPANSEFILECEFDIDDKGLEGPYTDFQGYYTDQKENYILKVKAITHRKDPIYETSMTGHVPEG